MKGKIKGFVLAVGALFLIGVAPAYSEVKQNDDASLLMQIGPYAYGMYQGMVTSLAEKGLSCEPHILYCDTEQEVLNTLGLVSLGTPEFSDESFGRKYTVILLTNFMGLPMFACVVMHQYETYNISAFMTEQMKSLQSK